MTGSPIVRQAEALAQAGRIADAYALLSGPRGATDGEAVFALASWRLSGQLIRRDLAEARRLFGAAGDLGHDEAADIHIAMLANGAGSTRHWRSAIERLTARAQRHPAAADELALLAAMALDADGEPLAVPPAEQLCAGPHILRVPALATPAECRYLIAKARPMLEPSVVIDPRSGRFVRDPVRTSAAAAFPFVLESPVLHAIGRRIARISGTRPEQGEPPQILRYGPGEEYRPHVDALPGGDNQRIVTVLIYLNDGYEGGGTHFPAANLTINGRLGDAIVFRNVTAAGAVDGTTRHAGLPVTRGEKFLLSRWIRARPLDLRGPPGRPF